MHNPWTHLPGQPPYVLSEDRDLIERFNARAEPHHFIHLDVMPEPFLGNPDAPVVLLNLNPGFDPSDRYFHHEHAHFMKTCRANLRHEAMKYPFYLLDPQNDESGGYKWWSAHLRQLIRDCGQQQVARQVFVIEYHGYHSRRYGGSERLPSQEYGFDLLRRAMARSALVVQMRSRRLWQQAVPDLQKYPLYYQLNSPQSAYVSPRNCPGGYSAIVEAIRR